MSDSAATPAKTEELKAEDTSMESPISSASKSKGKGKAVEDVSMDEEESSSDEEPNAEEPVEDNLEEIDTSNIMSDRTRERKPVDYQKAAEELGPEDDDEDDDADFEAPDEDSNMEH
ncbi:Histone H2A.Z-specific chaperone CHZ1 [Elasticomyces elasticus]|nr:Histone H2A.Z-specific chaperone CHZ1 [Elasticomyces elasticus]